jgi:DNA-directed RNA polymerase subunit L
MLLIIDACNNITSRLHYIQRNIEESQTDSDIADVITFINTEVIVKSAGNSVGTTMQKYVVGVKNETDTIGALLMRTICEMVPDISECIYSCVDHKKTMTLTVRNVVSDSSELEHLVIKAIKHNISILGTIKKEIQSKIVGK